VIAGFALINLGGGPMVVLSVDLVVGTAPAERAGSAAALNETGAEFGFAFGIAALGSLGTAIYRGRMDGAIPAGVPADAAGSARDTLAGATAAAANLPGDAAAALLGPARAAYTTGMHAAAGISAALLILVAGTVVVLLRHVPPSAAPAAEDAEPTPDPEPALEPC
jgi:DHA2 family multidrug resistance protein-like MFS transporter